MPLLSTRSPPVRCCLRLILRFKVAPTSLHDPMFREFASFLIAHRNFPLAFSAFGSDGVLRALEQSRLDLSFARCTDQLSLQIPTTFVRIATEDCSLAWQNAFIDTRYVLLPTRMTQAIVAMAFDVDRNILITTMTSCLLNMMVARCFRTFLGWPSLFHRGREGDSHSTKYQGNPWPGFFMSPKLAPRITLLRRVCSS